VIGCDILAMMTKGRDKKCRQKFSRETSWKMTNFGWVLGIYQLIFIVNFLMLNKYDSPYVRTKCKRYKIIATISVLFVCRMSMV
jgi:hypothetical protein